MTGTDCRLRRRGVIVGALLAVLALTSGCGASGVNWDDYPGVESRLLAMQAARDCSGLQLQFDDANQTNEEMAARTGHDNRQLMAYIAGLMSQLACPAV